MTVPAPRKTDAEILVELRTLLGVEIKNPILGVSAITHKSYFNEHRADSCGDNERLEFLGDAVVDLVIGQRLMERFPAATEGELSKLRALIVNEESLSRVARAIGLGALLSLGRGEELTGGREKPSVLADALEAVIGAVYLSNGIEDSKSLIDRLFQGALDGVAQGRGGQDFKTVLQERTQNEHRLSPRYRVVAERGPDHEKTFVVEVLLHDQVLASAEGHNKKEAEQAAAKTALALLNSKALPPKGDGE